MINHRRVRTGTGGSASTTTRVIRDAPVPTLSGIGLGILVALLVSVAWRRAQQV